MRLDGPVKDLTEAQKRQADLAGIPADRPGLGAEYPKMIYSPGENPRHKHLDQEIPIGNGKYDPVYDKLAPGNHYRTAFVDNPEEEAQALADGWFLSPDRAAQEAELQKREAEAAKDNRIAELEAQLAAQQERRGPGRPRNDAA